jgi:hypothetical protein
MFIKKCVVYVYKINSKSVTCIINKDIKKVGVTNGLMLTCAKSSFKNEKIKVGSYYDCDISITKDKEHKVWFYVERVNEVLG